MRRVAGRQDHTLLLIPDRRADGDTITVALPEVVGLEVSRGRLGRTLAASLVGGLVAATASAVYAYNAYDPGPRECVNVLCNKMPRWGLVTVWALGGARAGLALGALTGRFALGERWERLLPSGRHAAVGPDPARSVRLRPAPQ